MLPRFLIASAICFIALGSIQVHAAYNCSLSVGSDDSVDLNPDEVMAMVDKNGKKLGNIALKDNERIELSSDVIVAEIETALHGWNSLDKKPSREYRDVSLAIGLNLPGVGKVLTRKTFEVEQIPAVGRYDRPNAPKSFTLTLDLRGAEEVRKRLGKTYNKCEADRGEPCHVNVAYVSCEEI